VASRPSRCGPSSTGRWQPGANSYLGLLELDRPRADFEEILGARADLVPAEYLKVGLNLWRLGKIDNYKAERWKQPRPQLIEDLYVNRFGRERPGVVASLEERAQEASRAKTGRKKRRAAARAQATGHGSL
jgi:hypothetical protein